MITPKGFADVSRLIPIFWLLKKRKEKEEGANVHISLRN